MALENQRNEETKNRICEYLKEGMFKKDSAVMAGISEATFYRWLEEDESFESRVEASILQYKQTLIKNINVCVEKDGRLALEVLKRRFPKEWGDNASIIEIHEGYENERKDVRELLEKVYEKERVEKNTAQEIVNTQSSHEENSKNASLFS